MTHRRTLPTLLLFTLLIALTTLVAACGNGTDSGDPAAEPPELPRDVAAADYQTTGSGLQIFDFSEGSGDPAELGDVVRVNYTGWLRSDSTRFDSSIGRGPFEFRIGAGRVIQGWEEGVEGMKVGGERQLVIPPELGYGSQGTGPIPGNATLIFEIEMLEIE